MKKRRLARTARSILLLLIVAVVAPLSLGQAKVTAEQRTSRYLDSVRQQPLLLLAFLRDMPKGGDLHNHLAGAIYAESMIDFAAQDGLCIDRATLFLAPGPCDAACDPHSSKPAVSCGYRDPALYNSIVDAWSMRNWQPGEGSGHDHFFASFDKFFASTLNHIGDSIAEASARAAQDHLQYLELMHTAGGLRSAELGTKLGWDNDFARIRQKLLAGGLPEIIAATRKELDADEAKSQLLLKCGTPVADPGCAVTVRYLYQVLRGLPREQVFAQILMGFELAQTDPRFVGFNLVMPEDWYVPMRDFELHMRMIDYLHGVYPKVHISLHADELAMGLVPPDGLRFHIRDSIELGHAERIGHGVAVMNERDPIGLLREMAQRQVLVEICLTSNDGILGVRGKDHPLPIYMKYGVPVALATDDEGVSRSDMTHEYLRAVQTYDLSYADLKRMARQSEEHSFLPGASLWADTKTFRPVAACAGDLPDAGKFSAGCTSYLDQNQRAREQWKLEREIAVFEKKVVGSQ
jgi:hypothetical protein